MISRCTSSGPKGDVVFPRLLNCDSRCSQTCRRRSEACCWPTKACCWRTQTSRRRTQTWRQRTQTCRQRTKTRRQRTQTCHRCSQVLPGAPKVLSGAVRCSRTYHNHFSGTPVPGIRDLSYSEGRPECCRRVWYSPEFDESKFTLHILSNTPGDFQRLKYNLLMNHRLQVVQIDHV